MNVHVKSIARLDLELFHALRFEDLLELVVDELLAFFQSVDVFRIGSGCCALEIVQRQQAFQYVFRGIANTAPRSRGALAEMSAQHRAAGSGPANPSALALLTYLPLLPAR